MPAPRAAANRLRRSSSPPLAIPAARRAQATALTSSNVPLSGVFIVILLPREPTPNTQRTDHFPAGIGHRLLAQRLRKRVQAQLFEHLHNGEDGRRAKAVLDLDRHPQ